MGVDGSRIVQFFHSQLCFQSLRHYGLYVRFLLYDVGKARAPQLSSDGGYVEQRLQSCFTVYMGQCVATRVFLELWNEKSEEEEEEGITNSST